MRSAFAAVALILTAGPVLAEPLPQVDVAAVCKRYSLRPENQANSEGRFSYCLENEQRWYDLLKTQWADAAEVDQRTCISKTDATVERFYSRLANCLTFAPSDRDRPPPQKEFRY